MRRLRDVTTAGNLGNRKPHPLRPNELWVIDITQHRLREGWLYCAAVSTPTAAGSSAGPSTPARTPRLWSTPSTRPSATVAPNPAASSTPTTALNSPPESSSSRWLQTSHDEPVTASLYSAQFAAWAACGMEQKAMKQEPLTAAACRPGAGAAHSSPRARPDFVEARSDADGHPSSA